MFTQQKLGEAYEEKGDAPDAVKLLARREAYQLGTLPPGVLVLTMAVDVQVNRLEFAVWGWGIGKTSWLVDKGIVEGDPSLPATWRPLDAQVERRYPDALGNVWPIDRVAVDSGYLTQAVYTWARGQAACDRGEGNGRASASGPWHAVIPGSELAGQEVETRHQAVAGRHLVAEGGVLRQPAQSDRRPRRGRPFSAGLCALPEEVDEKYFEQLTAESMQRTEHRGRVRQAWLKRPGIPNEALDMRVYAGAAAAHLGIDAWNRARWAQLAAQRAVRPELAQGDLEQVWGGTAVKLVDGLKAIARRRKVPEQCGAAGSELPAPDTSGSQAKQLGL